MAQRSAKKTALKPVQITAVQAPLPSVFVLTKRSLRLLRNSWLTFTGIGVVYALTGLLFGGLAVGGFDVVSIRDQLGGKLVGGFGAYAALLSSGGGVSQVSEAYSLILFVIASLAIIWALRHAHEGKKIRIRDAYYKGMYPLVPFMLIMLVALLTLIPMLIGSALYQYVLTNGIAEKIIEIILWGLVAAALLVASLYLIVVPILALYVVALPSMTPVLALRSASRLVLGRRWAMVRKMLFLPVVILVIVGIIMLPFILFVPALAQWALAILTVFAITLTHGYLYELYRSSMDEL